MKTYNDCIPCLVRQALGAARFISKEEAVHQRILQKTLAAMARMDMNQPPPMMAQYIQQVMARETGNPDPYKDVKKKFNTFALGLLNDLKKRVEQSDRPLDTAVRLAIAGNIIDFGARTTLEPHTVLDTIDHALAHRVRGDMESLLERLATAERLLWIGDNAGEIVFDRLVLEMIPHACPTFVVRGGPALNDATLADAAETGISARMPVITSGAAIPGTVLKACSPAFLKAFQSADVIIAKGQGNYETLPHDDGRIFFLFKAKCPVVATSAGVDVGDMVVRRGTMDTP